MEVVNSETTSLQKEREAIKDKRLLPL